MVAVEVELVAVAVPFDRAEYVCFGRFGEATTAVAVRASKRESIEGRMLGVGRPESAFTQTTMREE